MFGISHVHKPTQQVTAMMIETGKRVRWSDGVCLAWWIEESQRWGRGKMDRRVADVFWQMLLPLLKKKEKGSLIFRQCPGLLLGNWSLVWRCMRWSVIRWWKVTCAGITFGFLHPAYPVSLLCQSKPLPSPLSLPSSTVLSVPASSRLWSSHFFLPMSGDPFQGG